MSTEADKLRAEIATADQRIAELEKRPGLTAAIQHQIDKAKNAVRDLRIKLAGMQDQKDKPCAHCGAQIPHAWFLCRPCMREVPLKLYARLVGAIGFHHHGLISDETLKETRKAVLSHLSQHSTAIV